MLNRLEGYVVAGLVSTLPLCMGTDEAAGNGVHLLGRTGPLASISPCAAGLVDQIRSQGNCSTTDIACLCSAGLANTDTFRWLLGNCAFPDALASQNVTTSACGSPVRDISSQYTTVLVPTNAVTGLIMVTRLVHARFFSSRQTFGADDWIVLVALILTVPATVINVLGLKSSGLGRDIWTLSLPEISEYAFYTYIMTLFYLTMMMLLKLTFCFLYLRIFPSSALRRLLWATVAFHILFGLATFISSVLTCIPINYLWMSYVREMHGRCIDVSGLYWTYGAVTVASDIWLLALPLRPVWRLQLHFKRKVGIAVMLMTGFLSATVISIIRFRSIFSFTTSINATYDGYAIGVWSDLEFNVGMICACLPSIRLFLVRLWPSVFESTGTRASRATSHAQTVERVTHGTFKATSRVENSRVGYTELTPVAATKTHNPRSRLSDEDYVLRPTFLTLSDSRDSE